MRRVLLLAIVFGTAGCDGRELPPELLGYVALFAGLALVALVVLLVIALVLTVLSAVSISIAVLNLRRPTHLTRALGMAVGTVDLGVGVMLVAGEAWMNGIHFSWWSGISLDWPAVGGLWLISLGALSILAAWGVLARYAPQQPGLRER